MVLLISFGTMLFLISLIPHVDHFVLDGVMRSIIYIVVFYVMVYWIKPAPELTNMFFDFLEKKNIKLLKRF